MLGVSLHASQSAWAADNAPLTTNDSSPTVVSLSPACTETLSQLGMESVLIGRSSACDYPTNIVRLAVFGDFATPNIELLVRTKPDILIANRFKTPTQAKTLEKAGIRVVNWEGNSVEDYRKSVVQLGELLKCPEAAQREIERIDERMAQFDAMPALTTRVMCVIWDSPLMVAGKGALADELLRTIKVTNVAGDVPQDYFKCSFDWVLKHPPDIIVWLAPPVEWATHRFWGRLAAVKEGRVISGLNPDLVSRPGPRMFDGMEQLRKEIEDASR